MIKVLIVEDDPMVAELNKKYMAQIEGFELVDAVASSDEAMACLNKKKVDLLLLDVFMPGINGLDLLTEIRAAGFNTDVIFVTAARDRESIEQALQHGAVDYLVKPFEIERLHAALQAYKQRRKMLLGREVFSQKDIDEGVLQKNKIAEATFPKGLDRHTLQLVWERIMNEEKTFSTCEMANQVGLSRVSMRKYLEYLTDIDLLSVEVDYGSIGRPKYKFRCVDRQAQFPF